MGTHNFYNSDKLVLQQIKRRLNEENSYKSFKEAEKSQSK